jgi:hypothetical protein
MIKVVFESIVSVDDSVVLSHSDRLVFGIVKMVVVGIVAAGADLP